MIDEANLLGKAGDGFKIAMVNVFIDYETGGGGGGGGGQ